MPEPGSFPDSEYLSAPARYWSFFVFNTNNGYFQATSHRRWSPLARTIEAVPAAEQERGSS